MSEFLSRGYTAALPASPLFSLRLRSVQRRCNMNGSFSRDHSPTSAGAPANLVDLGSLRVAIVHYFLISLRGGERVLEAICEVFPQADVFVLVYDPALQSQMLPGHKIRASFVQKLPFARRLYRSYLPLFPVAVEQFDLRGYDLVISNESGLAKGVLTNPETCHICYCHTPMRYGWSLYHDYLMSAGPLKRLFIPYFMNYIRLWDQLSANRVDYFIACSHNTERRIQKFYRRTSQVLYPPIDTAGFQISQAHDEYYLVVSELVSYKRVDLVVQAFNQLGRALLIVGDGPEFRRYKRLAKPNVQFLGRVSEHELAALYSKCRAMVFLTEEDIGMTALEANASGRPVIAYARGGALETVADGETGVLFPIQTAASLVEAVQRFEQMEGTFDPAKLRSHAECFDRSIFQKKFSALVQSCLYQFHKGSTPFA